MGTPRFLKWLVDLLTVEVEQPTRLEDTGYRPYSGMLNPNRSQEEEEQS
jgi:hypothetical protein